ncbi:hypothetical protein DSAG12_01826 [Promethearchaeum syntrophicum]|uniref:Uncharacterized protein n=1 Tax=Promethearchaeum syntrophicum TaxID=2594042 RepID=A0A5B9D9Q8_9ARCH|nr:hypothetical protein [Candidatus Prometheoarchaeum syntrophicum]QEE15998.1 hypothetical protein DSAG12_01826 [Candidatus Prometheoarchaeum syntrophicum]
MLLFIYFNPIIGPDILYSVPQHIEDIISEDDIAQIKRLMDAATPGFFTHAFSNELNTANYFFMLPSAWARGKQEMAMITKIIEEESPNLSAYETEFKKFIQIIKERKMIYKALYINNPPLNYEAEINEEFDFLTNNILELSEFFEITQAQTHGIILPFKDLRRKKSLALPQNILRDLEVFLEKRKNFFIVFQKRKENFKIDIMPYEKKQVLKISVIFNGSLSPDTLKRISVVFQEMGLPFLYTSGICQQKGQCIYEGYFNPLDKTDFSETKAKLEEINNVEEIKIVHISLT